MSQSGYELGKIKVVWIGSNLDQIYSKMFENEKVALEFAIDKENYLIFSLIGQKNMEEFAWKLLPYGRYKSYMMLVRTIKNKPGMILSFLEEII